MASIYDNIKHFTAQDGAVIEYADLEGMDKPTVLFIPGYSLSTDLVLPALAAMKEDFRIVTLTLRGFGGSKAKFKGSDEIGEISIAQGARDVRALIKHLGLKDCILVGYSMGSHVAFSYIQQYGCEDLSKLVILDMTPKLINDHSWNLGLYQGHYDESRYLYDIEAMTADYNKDFNKYFFHQAAFSHSRNEIRDYIFTGKMADDIEEYARWYNIPGLTGEILSSVPSHKWDLYKKYWIDMCQQDFRPMLKNITIPTGIFYAVPGSIYDEETAKYLESNISCAKLYPLNEASHTTVITKHTKLLHENLLRFASEF